MTQYGENRIERKREQGNSLYAIRPQGANGRQDIPKKVGSRRRGESANSSKKYDLTVITETVLMSKDESSVVGKC